MRTGKIVLAAEVVGRLRMAERLMISVNADCSVGNCLDSRRRYLKSLNIYEQEWE